jgi:hypothetical protein
MVMSPGLCCCHLRNFDFTDAATMIAATLVLRRIDNEALSSMVLTIQRFWGYGLAWSLILNVYR